MSEVARHVSAHRGVIRPLQGSSPCQDSRIAAQAAKPKDQMILCLALALGLGATEEGPGGGSPAVCSPAIAHAL